ncbi:MAG: TIGR04086 family membrane protein [Lachnospiraceae bacterium]
MEKNKKMEMDKTSVIINILFFVLIGYVVSIILLFVLAFILFKFSLTEYVVHLVIVGIYIISSFLSGFLLGKKMETKKYVWGLLEGVIYFGILIVLSMVFKQSIASISEQGISTFFICVVSGMLGGMIS